MRFAEITIRVDYDESKLTEAQRRHADLADKDIEVDHPLQMGVVNLEVALDQNLGEPFGYLGEGKDAVTISWLSE